jgi:hypothetical protein
VEPAAFAADDRWVSAPARLETDPERLVGSLNELPDPRPDPATREALLQAFRDLREPS